MYPTYFTSKAKEGFMAETGSLFQWDCDGGSCFDCLGN